MKHLAPHAVSVHRGPLQHQDTIFFKRLLTNKLFTRLPYFLTWENATAAEVQEVHKLGLLGATADPFASFAAWSKAFTQEKK